MRKALKLKNKYEKQKAKRKNYDFFRGSYKLIPESNYLLLAIVILYEVLPVPINGQ